MKEFLLFLANFFRHKYEPIKFCKIFNYKNFKCTCTSFENKMFAENTIFLQGNMNNDMLQAFLIASQQQQNFDIQQFQGMYTQWNTQQIELQKNPDNENIERDQEYDQDNDEE